MIDNWRAFSSDWNSPVFDITKLVSPQKAFYQQQTMVALLCTQQAVATELKAKRSLLACKQFVADIKASSWHHNAISIRFEERATGFDYEYCAFSRVCFKGNLTHIFDLTPPSVIATAKHKIDQRQVARKLRQFNELFPDLTQLWIFLSALTTAHFFHHTCAINDSGLRRIDPVLKHYKVQFDQAAINSAFYNQADLPDLEYAIHKLSVGRYCSYTLSLIAGDHTLMKVSLGIHQCVATSAEEQVEAVDILVE